METSLSNRFADLVQREWLDGGHPFSLRHGHAPFASPERERGPVFLLFLDAVWQVMQQFPLSFQFNERFLHKLLTHSYYSEFGEGGGGGGGEEEERAEEEEGGGGGGLGEVGLLYDSCIPLLVYRNISVRHSPREVDQQTQNTLTVVSIDPAVTISPWKYYYTITVLLQL